MHDCYTQERQVGQGSVAANRLYCCTSDLATRIALQRTFPFSRDRLSYGVRSCTRTTFIIAYRDREYNKSLQAMTESRRVTPPVLSAARCTILPQRLMRAIVFLGHLSMQIPQLTHFSGSMTARLDTISIASEGQAR